MSLICYNINDHKDFTILLKTSDILIVFWPTINVSMTIFRNVFINFTTYLKIKNNYYLQLRKKDL